MGFGTSTAPPRCGFRRFLRMSRHDLCPPPLPLPLLHDAGDPPAGKTRSSRLPAGNGFPGLDRRERPLRLGGIRPKLRTLRNPPPPPRRGSSVGGERTPST